MHRATGPSLIACLAAAALLPGGCGGDGEETPSRTSPTEARTGTRTTPPRTVPKPVYTRRADAICRAARGRSRRALGREQRRMLRDGRFSLQDATELNARGYAIARRVIARLRALPPPDRDRAGAERYLDLNDDALALGERIVAAGRRGDFREATKLATSTRGAARRIVVAARRFGFRECGRELSAAGG